MDALPGSSSALSTDDEQTALISPTVVAGLKNLGAIISLPLTKLLIANSLKLTLHPDASELEAGNWCFA